MNRDSALIAARCCSFLRMNLLACTVTAADIFNQVEIEISARTFEGKKVMANDPT